MYHAEDLFVPIFAIVFGIALVMLAIYLDYQRKTEALRLTHAERMAAIEKGIELPPPAGSTLLSAEYREAYQATMVARQRTAGLILLFMGASIMVAMWETGVRPYFWWGLVPAAIGGAHLVAIVMNAAARNRATSQGRTVEKQPGS
jgi:hypothetical protein